jgi:outer membrane protein
MKKTIQTLFALSALGATALFAQAQPAPKVLIIDLAKLYDGHYKTQEQNAKLRVDEQKAQEELDRLNKEGNDMVTKYHELDEQSKSPVATPEAKAKAQADAQKLMEDINNKQREVQAFQQITGKSLQQRIKNFRDLMIEEISKVAIDIAKRKGATLLIDKAGPTYYGISNIIYSDPSYDITDEVMAEINKDRPAASTTPAAAATPPADSGSDSPKITLPGMTPPK